MKLLERLPETELEGTKQSSVDELKSEQRLASFENAMSRAETPSIKNATHDNVEISALRTSEDDVSISGEDRSIDTEVGSLDLYIARPREEEMVPGLLLIHDRLGLVPHFRDVARRLAKLGYAVVAPDLLTIAGGAGSFTDHEENITALRAIDTDTKVTQLLAAYEELSHLPNVDAERLGCIGFCFGGTMTWLVATHEPRLKAAVPFYGSIPPLEDVPDIEAAVLAVYGALDERINLGIPEIEPAMAAAGKTFEFEVYEDSQHAFFNDTHAESYNPKTAPLAWTRATTYLAKRLVP